MKNSSIKASNTPCTVCGFHKIYTRSHICVYCRRRKVVAEMKEKYQPKPLTPTQQERIVMAGAKFEDVERMYD